VPGRFVCDDAAWLGVGNSPDCHGSSVLYQSTGQWAFGDRNSQPCTRRQLECGLRDPPAGVLDEQLGQLGRKYRERNAVPTDE
jgi:hypothetical protein